MSMRRFTRALNEAFNADHAPRVLTNFDVISCGPAPRKAALVSFSRIDPDLCANDRERMSHQHDDDWEDVEAFENTLASYHAR